MERAAEGHSPTSTPHGSAHAVLDSAHAAMDAALVAARRGVRGGNPLVGAAVLASDGTIVTGHHRGAGTPHAEAEALDAARAAGIDLTTSLVCVTLEPCTHHGRTGPCADLLIEAGVPEVVVALPDPNPSAAGGDARLRDAGVTVHTGLRGVAARALNARWLRAVDERRPYVTLKIAQSLDGRIAAADGTSQWISSPASRERVHTLRARVDAVVVGTGTALADDPRLTARPAPPTAPEAPATPEPADPEPADPESANPDSVVPDSGIPGTSPARRTAADEPQAPAAAPLTQPVPVVIGMRDLAPGSQLARDPRTVHLRTHDPLEALQTLHEQGIEHVLVEGGAHLAGAFVRAGLVDELELHIAPALLGDGLPGLADLGVTTLTEAVRWVPDDASDGRSDEASGGTSHDSACGNSGPFANPAPLANPDAILRLLPADSPPDAGSPADAVTGTIPTPEPTKGL